jgi:hypothetical protein
MIANWKALALAAVGLAAIAWLGPRGDTGPSTDADVAAQVEAYERGCASHRSTRCTVEIRYAYPAADLSVVPEDVYF